MKKKKKTPVLALSCLNCCTFRDNNFTTDPVSWISALWCQPLFFLSRGWSGGAKVLCKLPVPGRPTIWITVGQGPDALAVGAGGGCLDIFTLICPFSSLSPSLWETARYRLKYCLKGPLNPQQPTNIFLYKIVNCSLTFHLLVYVHL